MAIIATFSEGHKDHGVIIDWAYSPWVATAQYSNPDLAFILFDMAEDEMPVAITEFGAVSSHIFNKPPNEVECDRVYKQATIETKKVVE